FETRNFGGGDFDRLAGARIASGAGRTSLHRERAEAQQRYGIAGLQSLGDRVENRIDGTRGLGLLQARLGAHGVDQFRFVHIRLPSCRKPRPDAIAIASERGRVIAAGGGERKRGPTTLSVDSWLGRPNLPGARFSTVAPWPVHSG